MRGARRKAKKASGTVERSGTATEAKDKRTDRDRESMNGSAYRFARFMTRDGRIKILSLSRQRCLQLQELLRDGGGVVRATVTHYGEIVAMYNGANESIEMLKERFRVALSPLNFDPYIPGLWGKWIKQWLDEPNAVWLLFYGPEGTGKDTLTKILIDGILAKYGEENVEVIGYPPEYEDRFVGYMESKANQLADLIQRLKAEGKVVVVYLPELASIFGSGHVQAAWQTQFKSHFRSVLDGPKRFAADFVLAHTNSLSTLGGPTISRFVPVAVEMHPEFAQGVMLAHWPTELIDKRIATDVLDQLQDQPIAEVVLGSGAILQMRPAELTGYNGRMIAHYCRDLAVQIRSRQEELADFSPDRSFALSLLEAHLGPLVDALRHALGSREFYELLVDPPSMADPPVRVVPRLEWCRQSQFVVA